MAKETTLSTQDERRRLMIVELLTRQCRAGCWDNSEIIKIIRSAGLAPLLTLEDVCIAVRHFEERRLGDEINEIYFNGFFLGGHEDESPVDHGLY